MASAFFLCIAVFRMLACISLFLPTMAVGDSRYDIGDPYAYPLCVPQDRLEDIEMFPSFYDDLINLNDMGGTPPVVGRTKQSVALRDSDNSVANDHKIVSDLGDFPSEKVAGETKQKVVFHYYNNSVANDRETKRVVLQDSNSRETKQRVAFRDSDNSVANDHKIVSDLGDIPSKKVAGETKQKVVFHYYNNSVANDRETKRVVLQDSNSRETKQRVAFRDSDNSVANDHKIVSDLGDIPSKKVAGETKHSVVFHYYDNSVAKDRETNRVASQDSDINRIDLQDFDSSVAHINCGIAKKKPRTSRGCGRELSSWQLEWSNRAESWEKNMKKRRCSHCKTEKTPQWREGPYGPKTLCNACGVRFRSGRLVVEYRPAKSPTFDNRNHSNFHKQILKRKQACG
jgi:hypothetical protein